VMRMTIGLAVGPVIRVLHAVTHGGSILTMLATH
jgi:hypothetical protein